MATSRYKDNLPHNREKRNFKSCFLFCTKTPEASHVVHILGLDLERHDFVHSFREKGGCNRTQLINFMNGFKLQKRKEQHLWINLAQGMLQTCQLNFGT